MHAVGLGTTNRRSAGAIAILLGVLFVLPARAPLLSSSIRDTVAKLLPYNAGQAIFNSAKTAAVLSPRLGLAVFALYAAAVLRHRHHPRPPPRLLTLRPFEHRSR